MYHREIQAKYTKLVLPYSRSLSSPSVCRLSDDTVDRARRGMCMESVDAMELLHVVCPKHRASDWVKSNEHPIALWHNHGAIRDVERCTAVEILNVHCKFDRHLCSGDFRRIAPPILVQPVRSNECVPKVFCRQRGRMHEVVEEEDLGP